MTEWNTSMLVYRVKDTEGGHGTENNSLPQITGYYDTTGFLRKREGTLDAYGRALRIEGPVAGVLIVLTLAGLQLVLMINVAVVVEVIFSWPGVGRLLMACQGSGR